LNKVYKIGIVDDHPLFLDGLTSMFKGHSEFEVVSMAVSGTETLSYLNNHKIDVLISDINMPNLNGIELCKKVKALNSDIAILIISMHEEPKTINDVINAGANGYLFKNSNKTTILTAVLHVAKGGFYLSNEVTQKLENNKESVSKTKSFIPSLSGREKEILQLVSKGLTTDQIADKLCISHHTVLSHRKNLLLKFDVNNTASLVKKAIDANLID
jgi:DNA-binding NarL/FixJ family response regulator